jgi:hypothetical protein
VEHTKIPEYSRQKKKDTILALDFIRRIDDLARTNNWSNTVTYSNIANTLRVFTQKWLFSTLDMLNYMANQLSWMNIKPRFQIQFLVQTDDNHHLRPIQSCDEANRDHWQFAQQGH